MVVSDKDTFFIYDPKKEITITMKLKNDVKVRNFLSNT